MSQKNNNDLLSRGEVLPLMEEFYTLQGEGFHKGKAAYFIRVGGCDLGCHWCDVKESWDAEIHPLTKIDVIANNAAMYSNIAVVTGGEPLTWNMDPLTNALQKKGLQTHIETSGAYVLSGNWNWICLSPKKVHLPQDKIYGIANELKIIIYNKNDFKFAERQAARVNPNCILYLQPEWSKREQMIPLIIDFVKTNSKWAISLQTHKYLNIP